MTENARLACGGCGASLPANTATCTFCGATAAPAPRVVERVIERVIVVGAQGEALRCPRCGGDLRQARANETSLHGCRGCGGVFIDRENLARFGNNDHAAEALAERVIGPSSTLRLLSPDQRATVGCPICTKVLRREGVRFTRAQVDICDAHGVWLDWGEITPFLRPPSDDPYRDLTPEELEAAGISGTTNADDGFFTNLKRLLFGD